MGKLCVRIQEVRKGEMMIYLLGKSVGEVAGLGAVSLATTTAMGGAFLMRREEGKTRGHDEEEDGEEEVEEEVEVEEEDTNEGEAEGETSSNLTHTGSAAALLGGDLLLRAGHLATGFAARSTATLAGQAPNDSALEEILANGDAEDGAGRVRRRERRRGVQALEELEDRGIYWKGER